MKHLILLSTALILVAGCGKDVAPVIPEDSSTTITPPPPPKVVQAPPSKKLAATLVEARRGFQTKPAARQAPGNPAPEPPATVFQLIKYDSPVGKLSAYLTPDPGDARKHPAIIWITGGDCNTIDELWTDSPRENDQTAAAYRKAGIVMMFPSLRGGNDNPGSREGFFGEVNDVLAAADHLASQKYVDPSRIYLGGHSTGGTMVMLVAESSNRFRGVFAFGPVHDVSGYDPTYLTFDTSNPREIALRSPGRWLGSVRSPLFVLEGTGRGNLNALQIMAKATKNPMIHFLPVKGVDHFSILAPVNEVIAQKILLDTGPSPNITLAESELDAIPK